MRRLTMVVVVAAAAIAAAVSTLAADAGVILWTVLQSAGIVASPACPDGLLNANVLCTTPTSLVITRIATAVVAALLAGLLARLVMRRVRARADKGWSHTAA